MDPVTGDGLLAAGTGLFGAISSIFSQKDANAENRQLYREQMASQLRENQLNRDWQYKMWQENNAYNTPFMQKIRLESAGLNPYLVNGEEVGATPSSMPSAPQTPALPGAPTMQPLPYQNLAGALQPLLQAEQVDSGAQQSRAAAISSIVQSSTEIYKTYGKDAGDAFLNKYLPLIAGGDFEGSDTHQYIQAQVKYQMSMSELNNIEAGLQRQYGSQRFQDMHSEVEQRISQSVAELQALHKRLEYEGKTVEQRDRELELKARELASQIMVNAAQAGHLNADTATIDSLRPWLKKSAENKALSDYVTASEDYSKHVSRKALRSWRRSGLYQSGVALNAGASEIGADRAANFLLKAFDTAHPVKAMKRAAPLKPEPYESVSSSWTPSTYE